MTRKILNKSSPGDASTFGADDIDTINALLTGTDQTATDPVDINTQWTFRSSKTRHANPANTFYYTMVGSAIGADRNLTLPLLTGNDTVVAEAHTQTLTNKTMAFGSNTFTGFVTPSSSDTFTNKTISGSNNTLTNLPSPTLPPESKKIGGYYGGIYTAGATLVAGTLEGSLSGYTQATTTGTASYFSDAAGRYTRQTSGAVSGNDAGFNVNTDATTNPIIAVRPDQNPRLKVKFRTSTNTNVRLYIGFTTSTATLLTGDAPFASGATHIALLLKATGNYLFSHNDASGPAIEDTITGPTRNSNANTVEIKTADAGVTWAWDLNGTTGTQTANVPATTTTLYPIIQIETSEAVAKTLDTWYWLLETSA